jgi:hypothetical protein
VESAERGKVLKRRYLVIQVLNDGTEKRAEITAGSYRSAWRNQADHAMHLEATRSIVIHEFVTYAQEKR